MALQTTPSPEKRRGSMTTEESEIQQTVERFNKAFDARNLEEIMSFYAPDVVAFDMMPPLQIVGRDAYRENWKKYVTGMKGQTSCKIRDLQIGASGDTAFCHFLAHMTGTTTKDEKMDIWMRQTVCFRKENGKWLIVHENYSVPVDMETDKALWNLDPDKKTAH